MDANEWTSGADFLVQRTDQAQFVRGVGAVGSGRGWSSAANTRRFL